MVNEGIIDGALHQSVAPLYDDGYCYQATRGHHYRENQYCRNEHILFDPHSNGTIKRFRRSATPEEEVLQAKPRWQDGICQQVKKHPGLDP